MCGRRGVEESTHPRIHNFSCDHTGGHGRHTVHLNSTASQQPPHRRSLTFSFCTTVHQAPQRVRDTYKDTHTPSRTWLNVTVRHVLICWRYRVSDCHVVTFTRDCEFLQYLPGAQGDGKAWYVYGKTLSCPFNMEAWSSHSGSPRHIDSLCMLPSPDQTLPDLSCVTLHLYLRAHVCTFVCEWSIVKGRQQSVCLAYVLLFFHVHFEILLYVCLTSPPHRWKSFTVITDWETASADTSLFTSITSLASPLSSFFSPSLTHTLFVFLALKAEAGDKQF